MKVPDTTVFLKQSKREEFFWREDAERLHWAGLKSHAEKEIPESVANAPKGRIEEYREIALSRRRAFDLISKLAKGFITMEDLNDRRRRDNSLPVGVTPPPHGIEARRLGLVRAAVTGTVTSVAVRAAIRDAMQAGDIKFFIKLGKALSGKKRRPDQDWKSINQVARFLVHYWCGGRDPAKSGLSMRGVTPDGKRFLFEFRPAFWMPPLCFFSNGALSSFCAIALGKEQSEQDTSITAVRQWVSRLRLKRASPPKIREVKEFEDGILCL